MRPRCFAITIHCTSFGDFDLLLGAAGLGLRIVDLPLGVQSRANGRANISRRRHGFLLVQIAFFAFWKFRVEPVGSRAAA